MLNQAPPPSPLPSSPLLRFSPLSSLPLRFLFPFALIFSRFFPLWSVSFSLSSLCFPLLSFLPSSSSFVFFFPSHLSYFLHLFLNLSLLPYAFPSLSLCLSLSVFTFLLPSSPCFSFLVYSPFSFSISFLTLLIYPSFIREKSFYHSY